MMNSVQPRPSQRKRLIPSAGKIRSIAVGAAICAGISAVHADTEISTTLTIKVVTIQPAGSTATPPSPDPIVQGETIFFKGGNARTVVSGGPITIYNGKEGKVYTLDPVEKTYYVQSFKDLLAAHSDSTSGRSGPLKVTADISLNPGDGAKAVAGLDAKVYILSGTVTASPPSRGGGGGMRGLGGLGGFGGFGGGRHGGGGGGGNSNSRAAAKKVEVSGEYWISDKLHLPDDRNASPLPAIFSATEIQNFVFGPVSDSLLKKKALPLDSRISVTSQDADGTQKSVTRTSVVTSVLENPLPDSMFQLPVGYTQIAPPNQ